METASFTDLQLTVWLLWLVCDSLVLRFQAHATIPAIFVVVVVFGLDLGDQTYNLLSPFLTKVFS